MIFVVAVVSVLLPIVPAPAIVLDESQALDLDIGDAWTRVEAPEGALARWERGGETVVVARSRGNTDGAYAKDKAARTTYLDGIERGVRDETPGYRRIARAERTLGSNKAVPVLDLWFSGPEGVRGMRFLLYRGYTVVLALASPGKKRTAEHRRIVESFRPVSLK
ncbi:MAG TPA: hypothetical protein VKE22_19800 [Haliangiales bacterium]|nr:hypothetical protein [Haliangiales bacterium]